MSQPAPRDRFTTPSTAIDTTRVVVAVGTPLVCEAYVACLSDVDGFHALGAPGDRDVALSSAAALAPDVIVIDSAIVNGDARLLFDEVARLSTRPRVIALVSAGDVTRAAQFVREGAMGVVPKDAPSSDLFSAIRGAAEGVAWISPPLLRGVLTAINTDPRGEGRLGLLTAREREVLQLLVDGLGRPEIADRLYVSVDTVRTHLCSIMAKLEVHSAPSAVAYARNSGFKPSRPEQARRELTCAS